MHGACLGWNIFGLGLLVPLKGNIKATAYKDFWENCVILTLWQQFKEDPYMAVMVRCSQTLVIQCVKNNVGGTEVSPERIQKLIRHKMVGSSKGKEWTCKLLDNIYVISRKRHVNLCVYACVFFLPKKSEKWLWWHICETQCNKCLVIK